MKTLTLNEFIGRLNDAKEAWGGEQKVYFNDEPVTDLDCANASPGYDDKGKPLPKESQVILMSY